jgi:DNA damage-inducible protein 1
LQACIDLGKNCLRINNEEIAFLPEHELPDRYREKNQEAAAEAESHAASTALSSSSTAPAPVSSSSSAAVATAAPAPKSPAKPTNTAAASQGQFPEQVIQGIMDLGASRAEALMVLEQSGGNAEVAANLFFQIRFG